MRLAGALALLTGWLAAAPSRADPVRVFGAGILVGPVKEAIAASGLPPGAVAEPVFGPAGLLRERIAGGEPADLYLSADLAQPRRLVEAGRGRLVVPFARSRLCVVARTALGLTPETLLDRLLAADLRLATSTPVLDAAGDFTEAVYARADLLRAGAGGALRRKALKLIGTPGAMTPVGGHTVSESIFMSDRADALLYYCSGQSATVRAVPGLSIVELPATLAVPVVLGMAIVSDNPDAMRLALFLLSEPGQAILAKHELIPIGAALDPGH